MDPLEALRQIAFLLERAGRADLPRAGLPQGRRRCSPACPRASSSAGRGAGTLEALKGIGDTTAQVVTEALAGEVPGYLARLRGGPGAAAPRRTTRCGRALRGDCHLHSDWSDGGSPIEEMARRRPATSATNGRCSPTTRPG